MFVASEGTYTIIRPRLTDYYGIAVAQAQLDFAVPFLDEDIPLYVDPFLLWASPSLQDNSLHTMVVNSFNHLGYLARKGDKTQAVETLIALSECNEVGLGTSRTRRGKPIGQRSAESILSLFDDVPAYAKNGFVHFEEIQFFVDQIAKDRISDFTCSLLKSFLIDFTIDQCKKQSIPIQEVKVSLYDYKNHALAAEKITLPVNPESGDPILFVPKRWLRFNPWLDFDEYFTDCLPKEKVRADGKPERVEVLNFNRHNYGMVRDYVLSKERVKQDCHNDPLFKQIPITSAKSSFNAIQSLATGTDHTNDKKYEREAGRLMASLLYPHLDFADTQSRTDEGVLIRDLIFYNNQSHPLLSDIWEKYASRQVVFELKNVKAIDGGHINQLNRYLTEGFGRFGILLTRNSLKSAALKNTLDLWAGQRRCILAIADADVELMVNLYEGKQRDPIDVLNMKYVEFMRRCPS
jgi:hypothetical protein